MSGESGIESAVMGVVEEAVRVATDNAAVEVVRMGAKSVHDLRSRAVREDPSLVLSPYGQGVIAGIDAAGRLLDSWAETLEAEREERQRASRE